MMVIEGTEGNRSTWKIHSEQVPETYWVLWRFLYSIVYNELSCLCCLYDYEYSVK